MFLQMFYFTCNPGATELKATRLFFTYFRLMIQSNRLRGLIEQYTDAVTTTGCFCTTIIERNFKYLFSTSTAH